jgi:hypothetical protein
MGDSIPHKVPKDSYSVQSPMADSYKGHQNLSLKGLSHEIDFGNIDKN